MSSDQNMAPNDKKDLRFRDMRKGSPDRWGKPGRRDNTPPMETNRNDPHSIRCRVFIGNLQMSRKELEDIFSQYGKVVGCSVHNNYGFVQFEDEKSADASVAKENGKVYNGKRVGELLKNCFGIIRVYMFSAAKAFYKVHLHQYNEAFYSPNPYVKQFHLKLPPAFSEFN